MNIQWQPISFLSGGKVVTFHVPFCSKAFSSTYIAAHHSGSKIASLNEAGVQFDCTQRAHKNFWNDVWTGVEDTELALGKWEGMVGVTKFLSQEGGCLDLVDCLMGTLDEWLTGGLGIEFDTESELENEGLKEGCDTEELGIECDTEGLGVEESWRLTSWLKFGECTKEWSIKSSYQWESTLEEGSGCIKGSTEEELKRKICSRNFTSLETKTEWV